MFNQILAQALNIAALLMTVEGVRAVVLGGSWARGAGDPGSDIDLGLYYDPAQPPDIAALRALASTLDDSRSGEPVTDFGAWGAWINGGAWLTINGQRVDWLYRDLALVRRVVDECINGQPRLYYQPGHPHGFHTHIYLGELAYCLPLADPFGAVHTLKALTSPYPPKLKRALIDNSLWEAGFALETSRKSVKRGDVFHVSGSLFRCAACLIQVLYALNETYWINEKGSLQRAGTFPLCPPNFEAEVSAALCAPSAENSAARMEHLVAQVRALCADSEIHPL
jgi:predicted nucleotidyltransferase